MIADEAERDAVLRPEEMHLRQLRAKLTKRARRRIWIERAAPRHHAAVRVVERAREEPSEVWSAG